MKARYQLTELITLSSSPYKMDRVSFFGPMCSGKTYLARQLQEYFGHTKVGFADKLKSVAIDLYQIDPKDKNGATRKLLQEFADDIKKWDAQIFIKHFLLSAEKYKQVVCDDMRFYEESVFLRQNEFTLIKVNCDEARRQERIQQLYPSTLEGAQSHRSETDYLKIVPDFEVNSNSPSDVKELVDLVRNYGY